jgi:hypothetical protein
MGSHTTVVFTNEQLLSIALTRLCLQRLCEVKVSQRSYGPQQYGKRERYKDTESQVLWGLLTGTRKVLLLKGHVLAGRFGRNGVHLDAFFERLDGLQTGYQHPNVSVSLRTHSPLHRHVSPDLC